MKILMFLRDPLPATRVDVSILFDVELRRLGLACDFVGVVRSSVDPVSVAGRIFGCSAGNSVRALALGDIARVLLHDIVVAFAQCGRYDIVIVRDRPIEAAVLFLIARMRGARTAYWMSFPIPLADQLSACAHWSRGARARAVLVYLRGWLGAVIERRISLPLADHIFVQSDAMKLTLRADGAPVDKMTSVPMGVDARLLIGVNAAEAKLDLHVVYVGTLNQTRQLDFLIDAFALVRNSVSAAKLLVIGDGDHPSERAKLQQRVIDLGLANSVRFAGRLPIHEAFALTARCTVGVSPIPPGKLFDVSSPTKAVEYLALGLPVIGNDIPDQRHIIECSGGGICVPYQLKPFALAVSELLCDPQRAAAMGAAGRSFVLAHRTYGQLAELVANALNQAGVGRSRTASSTSARNLLSRFDHR